MLPITLEAQIRQSNIYRFNCLQKEKPYRHKLLNIAIGISRRGVRVNQETSILDGHTPADADNLLGDNIDLKKIQHRSFIRRQ
jgi:hypothetical protein